MLSKYTIIFPEKKGKENPQFEYLCSNRALVTSLKEIQVTFESSEAKRGLFRVLFSRVMVFSLSPSQEI